jgi:hypothetical protein
MDFALQYTILVTYNFSNENIITTFVSEDGFQYKVLSFSTFGDPGRTTGITKH